MIEILAATEEDKKFMREPNQSGGLLVGMALDRTLAMDVLGHEPLQKIDVALKASGSA